MPGLKFLPLQWHFVLLFSLTQVDESFFLFSFFFITRACGSSRICRKKTCSHNISYKPEMIGSSMHGWPRELRWPSGMQKGALLIKGCTRTLNFCTSVSAFSLFQPPLTNFLRSFGRRSRVCPVKEQQHFYLFKDSEASESGRWCGNK